LAAEERQVHTVVAVEQQAHLVVEEEQQAHLVVEEVVVEVKADNRATVFKNIFFELFICTSKTWPEPFLCGRYLKNLAWQC
jgi:hypothetical protein